MMIGIYLSYSQARNMVGGRRPAAAIASALRICRVLNRPEGADKAAGADLKRAHVTSYKICKQTPWQAAQSDGPYRGSPVHRGDAFIPQSTVAQVAVTASKHSAHKTRSIMIALKAGQVRPKRKRKSVRGGGLFPDLYETLPLSTVCWARPLPDAVNSGRPVPELKL
ncbi:MAG: DUF952 domain-containing protein [Pseudomonadota bacterium]